jgi:hypothetical protein
MKTHDKDQTGKTFDTEGFFKNTALNTSISAQEGSGLVNQSPPPYPASSQIEDLTKEVERLKADVEVLLNNVDKHSDQSQKKLDHARFDIDTCLFIQKSKKLKD